MKAYEKLEDVFYHIRSIIESADSCEFQIKKSGSQIKVDVNFIFEDDFTQETLVIRQETEDCD